MRRTPSQRAYRERNLERIRAEDRERYHRTKHLKQRTDEDRRYEADWRAKNREKVREYARKYYEANKAKIAGWRQCRYRQKHPVPRVRRTPEVIRAQTVKASRRGQAKRNLFFWTLKSFFQCVDCGEGDPACLDYHHLDRQTKELNMGSAARYASRDRLIRELIRCSVTCVNCHRRRHHRLRNGQDDSPPIADPLPREP